MVTVKAYLSANSLDTDSTNCNSYRPNNRHTVEILLDHRVTQLTQLLKQTLASRIPTPPQPDENEVDNGDIINYRFEENRLESFKNWPCPYISAADMAAAGFYFTGKHDSVRCFECHMEFSRWEEGDEPMVFHQRWSGRCCFIRKLPCGNVPIGANSASIPVARPRNRDTCGPYSLEYRMGAEADTHTVEQEGSPVECPKFPKYASYEARLQSFADWPISMAQTKEQLAEAGLYYVGSGDMTACYQCGVGLKSWETEDDPWVQHAQWRPECSYVRLVKGQEFIENITGKDVIPPLEEDMAKVSFVNNPETIERTQIQENAESSNAQSTLSQDVVGSNSVVPSIANLQTKVPAKVLSSSTTSTNNNKTEDSQEKEKPLPDDATICKICYNDELGVVFVPCGHIVSCVKCAPSLSTCAVCRKRIEYYVRAYLS